MKKILAIVLIILSYSQLDLCKDNIVIISIPKSGTHLLLKCLSLFNLPNINYNYKSVKNATDIRHFKLSKYPPNHDKGQFYLPAVGPLPKLANKLIASDNLSLWSHWPYTKEFEKIINKNTRANLLMIRDPRDVAVSLAFMLHKCPEKAKNLFNGLTEISIDGIIMDLITGQHNYFIPWGVNIHQAYPLIIEKGICDYFRMYLPYLNNPKFCLVKFENLVGVKGGGTLIAQKEEIKKIAKHIVGFSIPHWKLSQVIENLYGNTWTFREGKINSWKKYFSKEHKEAFKKMSGANELLISLGYELNEDW